MTGTAAPARHPDLAALTAGAGIPGGDLRRLTASVTPRAADDPCTPTLCAVQWEIRDGALWLAATDTHTIGAARWQLPEATPAAAGPVLLQVSETILLAEAVGDGPAVITIDPAAAAVTAVWSGGTYQARGPLPALAEIPDWRSVLTGLTGGTPGPAPARLMFDPAHLTRFTPPPPGSPAGCEQPPPLLRFQLRRQPDHTQAHLPGHVLRLVHRRDQPAHPRTRRRRVGRHHHQPLGQLPHATTTGGLPR